MISITRFPQERHRFQLSTTAGTSSNVLFCARKVLDFCGLAEAASQILRSQATLLGGFTSEVEKILSVLPPSDEVVMEFVGRHKELNALGEWISRRSSKRWALSGEGGRGKSAIAYVFGRSIASRDDHDFEAVLWMSAKRRRFVEGKAILVDRPDFHDKRSAVANILGFFGAALRGDLVKDETCALELLCDFPSLLIVDDIDTVEGEGEDAIQFLVMTIPEQTKSNVLITSRRAIFGLANVTTQVTGLSEYDAEAFIKSRCALMAVPVAPVLALKDKLLEVTDASPLFLEDLLRLTHAGLPIDKAIGLWAEKRGAEARKYAIQREYDKLGDDARQVLLTLSIQGPCRSAEVCRGLGWPEDRLLEAMQQLRKMFLVPTHDPGAQGQMLAVNRNMQLLVLDVFRGSEAYRRTQRLMKAASGELRTRRSEERAIETLLRRARLLVAQYRPDDAETELVDALRHFPGRPDIYSTLGWVQRKRSDFASARLNFNRAHELNCKDRDLYWHWSEMEAANGEWQASADAASKGLEKFGDEQGLLFRHGYALHRLGKELILEEDSPDGTKYCTQAQKILERARSLRTSEGRNYALRSQIYRALALNLEVLSDGPSLSKVLVEWQRECPKDPYFQQDYDRFRQRFPQQVQAHDTAEV